MNDRRSLVYEPRSSKIRSPKASRFVKKGITDLLHINTFRINQYLVVTKTKLIYQLILSPGCIVNFLDDITATKFNYSLVCIKTIYYQSFPEV